MKKKILTFLSCILIIICAYISYSIYTTKKAINIAISNTIDLDSQFNSYIWEHANYQELAVGNNTFNLPMHYKQQNSPLEDSSIFKAKNSTKAFLNVHLNSNYLNLLPFTTPKVPPFIQFQYDIVDQQTIYKSCYTNLARIYVPKNCYPAF